MPSFLFNLWAFVLVAALLLLTHLAQRRRHLDAGALFALQSGLLMAALAAATGWRLTVVGGMQDIGPIVAMALAGLVYFGLYTVARVLLSR